MNNRNFGCPFHLFGRHIDDATTAHELYRAYVVSENIDARIDELLNFDQNAIACYMCYKIMRESELGTHYVYWAPLKYTVTVQFMFR